jgi:hypothetical protein
VTQINITTICQTASSQFDYHMCRAFVTRDSKIADKDSCKCAMRVLLLSKPIRRQVRQLEQLNTHLGCGGSFQSRASSRNCLIRPPSVSKLGLALGVCHWLCSSLGSRFSESLSPGWALFNTHTAVATPCSHMNISTQHFQN